MRTFAEHPRKHECRGAAADLARDLLVARSWLVLRVLLMGGCIGKAAPEARLMVGEPVIAMRDKQASDRAVS
jgi:hypothetical protein